MLNQFSKLKILEDRLNLYGQAIKIKEYKVFIMELFGINSKMEPKTRFSLIKSQIQNINMSMFSNLTLKPQFRLMRFKQDYSIIGQPLIKIVNIFLKALSQKEEKQWMNLNGRSN